MMKNYIKSFSVLLMMVLIGQCAYAQSPHIQPFETPVIKYLKPIDVDQQVMSGLDSIDCIYVINLSERHDKWKRVKKLFDERGLKVTRVGAVNGWKLSDETINEICGSYSKRVTKGHYGCLLSHLSILKDAYSRGFNVIWICEDDIEFVNDIRPIPRLLETLSTIDPEWDIFYTDIRPRILASGHVIHYKHTYVYDPRPDQILDPGKCVNRQFFVDAELMKINLRTGTTSMIISRKGMEKILNYFTHVYVWNPIDNELHFIPDIHEYTPTRDIVSNLVSSDSDTARINF